MATMLFLSWRLSCITLQWHATNKFQLQTSLKNVEDRLAVLDSKMQNPMSLSNFCAITPWITVCRWMQFPVI